MYLYLRSGSYRFLNIRFGITNMNQGVDCMKVTITGRKISLRDSFKEYTQKKLKKVERFFGDDADAQVTVTLEKDRKTVEVTVKTKGRSIARRKLPTILKRLWTPWSIRLCAKYAKIKPAWRNDYERRLLKNSLPRIRWKRRNTRWCASSASL